MTHYLRSYIAPGAPATRAPADGSEPALRVEFGFTPRWYRDRLGVDFSERWHLDPVYRHQAVVQMRRELNRRFPELALGGDPENAKANLDGVHGGLTMAMIFGVPVEYYADNWPAAQHAYLSEQTIAKLEVPSLADTPVIAQLLDQTDAIEREFGQVGGYINWQGVLNTSYRLRGHEILADMLIKPGLAHHLFEVVAQTMIDGMRLVYARQRPTGFVVEHATVSNCLVNMVSPEMYREHLLPYDKKIRAAFENFGIHNCAWNVDPYIEDYATVARLGYIDMGLQSDLTKAKRLCPDTRRALMYTPTDLANKPIEAIREDLLRVRRELAPCDIVMADIDTEVPDERVLAFARIAKQLSESEED